MSEEAGLSMGTRTNLHLSCEFRGKSSPLQIAASTLYVRLLIFVSNANNFADSEPVKDGVV